MQTKINFKSIPYLQAGRGNFRPPQHSPQMMLMKRMGPFANPQRQRQKIYNHPYMEMDHIYGVSFAIFKNKKPD